MTDRDLADISSESAAAQARPSVEHPSTEAGGSSVRRGPAPWFWPVVGSTFVALVMLFLFAATVMRSDVSARIGADYQLYMDATRTWLSGGSFYPAAQLQGPFTMDEQPILYPPYSLVLFVPFVALPAALWWAIPIGLTVIGLWRRRPARWVWPLLIAGLLWPNSIWLVLSGNPGMWVVAALAFGPRWPTAFVLLKPSLAPFALLGIRDRGWWLAVGGLVIVSLAAISMWDDYLVSLRNFDSGRGLAYSFGDLPLVLVPVIAWATDRRRRGAVA